MKVAILWTHLSGYMNACLKALVETQQVDLFVADIRVSEDAPFDKSLFSWIENRYQWEDAVNQAELMTQLERFQPDVILAAGWHNSGYRKVFKYFQGRAIRIFSMDNAWLSTPKQWLGVFISRIYLHPICDAVFVAGERQAVFAHKLGFPQAKIIRGVYTCDHEEFSKVHFARQKSQSESSSFVFVGRLVPEKGIDILVEAYRRYREETSNPWPLKCYGTGPLRHLIQGVEGIEYKGFCQPRDLPKALSMGSCLILPSIIEPWALVVHEASAAGMSIIASDAVGASVHLVQDGYNGYIVEAGNVVELTQAMLRYVSKNKNERILMSENSYLMSLQFTPKRWANILVNRAMELKTINKIL